MLRQSGPGVGVAELVVVVLNLVGLVGRTAGQVTVRHVNGRHANRSGVVFHSHVAETELSGVVGTIQQAVLVLVIVQVPEPEFIQRVGAEDVVVSQRDRLRTIILLL